MHICHKIKESAIFIADSHYNHKRDDFLLFLQKLKRKEIETTQLFLMGDMFDFISAESRYFVDKSKELIDILNGLSNDMEIIYLEGNHDYNLQELFPNISVYKREQQPIYAIASEKRVALSHGDIFTDKFYNIYCRVIRNSRVLRFLNAIDFNFFISKKIEHSLEDKIICKEMIGFEDFAKSRVEKYDLCDIVIEGHFHQGKHFKTFDREYLNIPSLFCSKTYVVYKSKEFIFLEYKE